MLCSHVNFVSQTEEFQEEAVAQPSDIVEIYNNFRAMGRFTAHRGHWNPNVLAGTKYHVAAADLLGQIVGAAECSGLE